MALPVQSQYFLKRIVKTTRSGSVVADQNLQNRMGKLQRTYAWIGSESHALGQGFVTVEQEPTAADILWMSADLVWVPVLYRLGLIGVATVLLLYVVSGWRAAENEPQRRGRGRVPGARPLGNARRCRSSRA